MAKQIYELAGKSPQREVCCLSDQLRRAAVSVPPNIAEGQARKLPGEFRHFLRVALGSLAEIDTQLVIASELGYVEDAQIVNFNSELVEIRKKI